MRIKSFPDFSLASPRSCWMTAWRKTNWTDSWEEAPTGSTTTSVPVKFLLPLQSVRMTELCTSFPSHSNSTFWKNVYQMDTISFNKVATQQHLTYVYFIKHVIFIIFLWKFYCVDFQLHFSSFCSKIKWRLLLSQVFNYIIAYKLPYGYYSNTLNIQKYSQIQLFTDFLWNVNQNYSWKICLFCGFFCSTFLTY